MEPIQEILLKFVETNDKSIQVLIDNMRKDVQLMDKNDTVSVDYQNAYRRAKYESIAQLKRWSMIYRETITDG